MTTLNHQLWEKVEHSKTKIAKKVYQCMNEDNFSVVEDQGVFYFEKTWSGARLPNYVYNYAVRFFRKAGYTYLYDLGKGYVPEIV